MPYFSYAEPNWTPSDIYIYRNIYGPPEFASRYDPRAKKLRHDDNMDTLELHLGRALSVETSDKGHQFFFQ